MVLLSICFYCTDCCSGNVHPGPKLLARLNSRQGSPISGLGRPGGLGFKQAHVDIGYLYANRS